MLIIPYTEISCQMELFYQKLSCNNLKYASLYLLCRIKSSHFSIFMIILNKEQQLIVALCI